MSDHGPSMHAPIAAVWMMIILCQEEEQRCRDPMSP